MPSKKPVKKTLRPAKAVRKASQKPKKKESLENRVVEIGKHVETLIKQKEPVSLVDAQREILEKLPQTIEGLSSQLEQIRKETTKSKEPRRLAGPDRELLGEIQTELQLMHKEAHTLRQALEEMRSSFDQVVSKLPPPAPEEQPKQAEEPKAE